MKNFFKDESGQAMVEFALVEMALAQFEALGGSSQTLYSDGLCIHVTGSLTFQGNGSSTYYSDFPITLVVEDSIDLNGASMESSVDAPPLHHVQKRRYHGQRWRHHLYRDPVCSHR